MFDWYNESKPADQYAVEKRWVFSLDGKEDGEDECLTERGESSMPDRERREFQITGPRY